MKGRFRGLLEIDGQPPELKNANSIGSSYRYGERLEIYIHTCRLHFTSRVEVQSLNWSNSCYSTVVSVHILKTWASVVNTCLFKMSTSLSGSCNKYRYLRVSAKAKLSILSSNVSLFTSLREP